MITNQELRQLARERKIPLDLVEKDYALGWILVGVSQSSLSKDIIFKGGTSLSKVHFPLNWRLSEDLDFTLMENGDLDSVSERLMTELPPIVEGISEGLNLEFKHPPYNDENFLRSRLQYTGPISKNTVKIEVTTESFIGDIDIIEVEQTYDYPEFSVNCYTLGNVFAEKMRTIIERGKIRDYYDVWRLLKEAKVDKLRVKDLFLKKCEAKGVVFKNVDQFFPVNIVDILEPYLETGLTRLQPDKLPSLVYMIEEMKEDMASFFQ